MKNYSQDGDALTFTAPAGGVISGTPVKIGGFFIIPAGSAAAGEQFTGQIEGVVDIPKVAAEPWTTGMLVWWNTGSALATSVSAGTMRIGIATRTEGNPTTTGRVKLVLT